MGESENTLFDNVISHQDRISWHRPITHKLGDAEQNRLTELINKSNSIEEFRNTYNSIDFVNLREEQIITMADSNFWQWSILWVQNLKLGDDAARYFNHLRKIWISFFKRLSEKAQANEIILSKEWERRVRVMALHCLPMDKANALYMLRSPWYSDPERKPTDIAAFTYSDPSRSRKIVYLLQFFELRGLVGIMEYLVDEFELPMDI